MPFLGTVARAVNTAVNTGKNAIKTIERYNKKTDSVPKAKSKSKVLKTTAPKPPKTLVQAQKPAQFNPQNKGAFKKKKTDQKVMDKIQNEYGFSPKKTKTK